VNFDALKKLMFVVINIRVYVKTPLFIGVFQRIFERKLGNSDFCGICFLSARIIFVHIENSELNLPYLEQLHDVIKSGDVNPV
jgi:hypothetical protein